MDRKLTSHDSSEELDAELNEEQLHRLRREVTALRQSLKIFTGGVLAAQRRRKYGDELRRRCVRRLEASSPHPSPVFRGLIV